MFKNISTPLFISLVAVFSFCFGFGLGSYEKTVAEEKFEELFSSLSIIRDGFVQVQEPYRSYWTSLQLFKATETTDSEPIEIVRILLWHELNTRHEEMTEYCMNRINEEMKNSCIKSIQQAEGFLIKYKHLIERGSVSQVE